MDISAEHEKVQVTWRYSLGYCAKLGQGTAPIVKLLVDDKEVWKSDINLATGDISGDGGCGGDGWKGGSMSKPQTFSADIASMTGMKTLKFQFQTFNRNIHIKVDKITLCSGGGMQSTVSASVSLSLFLLCLSASVCPCVHAFVLSPSYSCSSKAYGYFAFACVCVRMYGAFQPSPSPSPSLQQVGHLCLDRMVLQHELCSPLYPPVFVGV